MTVPDYQSIMLPLLRVVSDGRDHRVSDLTERLATDLALTDAERTVLLPSGRTQLFNNRVGWARTYLGKAGLLESPSRGTVRITKRGRDLLADKPPKIDSRVLLRYPEFVAFKQRAAPTNTEGSTNADVEALEQVATPEELIERSHRQLEAALADEILTRAKSVSPRFFEKLVLELLVAMGYGGTMQDAAQVVGQSGDGGIDGVIKEDKLGLGMIYVQAKRWENTVGRPVVQAFAGSLQGYRATKGVLITTATFSAEARDYVDRIGTRVVLIDGPTLARLMMEHDVGVTVATVYPIKRIDSDYFSEA